MLRNINISIIPKRFKTVRVRDERLADAFENAGIVPKVVRYPPMDLLLVKYDNYFKTGNVMCPKCVNRLPSSIMWEHMNRKTRYTLLLIDPDAPSRENPTKRHWQHWAIINMPGNSIYKGITISEYIGAAPSKGTGLHRYVFLVFKQKECFDPKNFPHLKGDNTGGRANFSLCQFMRDHGIEEVPDAGTFFYAKFDESVIGLKAILAARDKEIEEAKYSRKSL